MYQALVFVTYKPLQPSLMFVGKARKGAYLRVEQLKPKPTTIRQGMQAIILNFDLGFGAGFDP
jgi:hypothetical protein